jgi:D-arginine dehydrogenase
VTRPEAVDVLIVGAGIAGLSTAWWLARESPGTRILLLEASARLGTGSSGRSAAILRTFGGDPVTNVVARAGARWLERPRAHSSDPRCTPSGLVLGASGAAAATLASWIDRDPEGRFEPLAPLAALEAVPHLRRAPELALHFPREGRIEVDALLGGLASALEAAGVPVECDARVAGLLTAGATVEGVRRVDGREIRARRTVLAAGGWAGGLGRRAGSRVTLEPTRRHLLVTAPDAAVDGRWPVAWLEDENVYARPEEGGLLACACDTEPWDPDAREPFAVEPRREDEIRRAFERAFRSPLGPRARLWSGLRTLTADERFAIGPDPDLAGLHWVAGLGGHGMTSGLEVGRLAARQLLGRNVDATVARALDPARLVQARG